MKTKIAQKAIAAAMVVSLVAAPLTVFATESASSSSSTAATVAQATTGTSTPSTPAPATTEVAAGGKVAANGVTIYATTAGASTVKSIPALAVTAPEADLTAGLELAKGERAFFSAYDTSATKSPASAACIESAAASQGGTVAAMVNMTIGKMSGGKFKAGSSTFRPRVTMATPKKNANYCVVVVGPGGTTRVEQDQDEKAGTVTVNGNAGLAAYGIVELP